MRQRHAWLIRKRSQQFGKGAGISCTVSTPSKHRRAAAALLTARIVSSEIRSGRLFREKASIEKPPG